MYRNNTQILPHISQTTKYSIGIHYNLAKAAMKVYKKS